MPDLDFSVVGVEPLPFSASPSLVFKLNIAEAGSNFGEIREEMEATPIAAIALRCQIRIEPTRRGYEPPEQEGLHDLFGQPHRWGDTLHSMLWTHLSLVTPPFEGQTIVDMPVPCTFDFNVAATKYFDALAGGDVPLCFYFSGTIFHTDPEGSLTIEQISWEKEARFRLPVRVWRAMMDHYYPNGCWLNLHRDVFDRLARYKSRRCLTTWEQALETLLETVEAEERVPS